MSSTTTVTGGNATLIDTTKCVGCRSCQVSCKSWNGNPAEATAIDGQTNGLQFPTTLSAKTFTVITFNEVENDAAPGGLNYVFAKRNCMHCLEPACVSACPTTAMTRITDDGAVINQEDKCLGCRYCQVACPWGVPTAEWDSLAPKIKKCDHCHGRMAEVAPAERNGAPVTEVNVAGFNKAHSVPTCVAQCPPGALEYGPREEMLARAKKRMADNPGKYVEHIYGEHEAGGTAMLYLSAVPFEKLGFQNVGTQSYPARSVPALAAVPPAVAGVGAVLGATYALNQRRNEVKKAEAKKQAPEQQAEHAEAHVEFTPVEKKFWTPFNLAMAALAAIGGASLVARFALGLGGSTNLSDTWAWGLWIVFDLVWIAAAAGAFATAGIIYVFQRKDLYGIGRSAVLMGLLSYSFVMVTLLADVGLPWNFYWLGLGAPEHSAMFEVSWCVGLYVTVLLFEFLPVPFQSLGMQKAYNFWKKFSPLYVVFAITLFTYLMSRSLVWTSLSFVVFALMAYAFRTKEGQKPVPVMLAIAAVTFSTMHQSSLGSLFLLTPDKLNALWWSPVLPLNFLLSAIAAGISLVIVIEFWIARAYGRSLRMDQLASLGKIAFGSLAVYLAFRLGELGYRGQLGAALQGGEGNLFLVEMGLGLLPLVMLATRSLRESRTVLFAASAIAVVGVILNRVNVVALGMTYKGPMPQIAPKPYTPSFVEWSVSIGLIALAILLFGYGVRKFPVLQKDQKA